MFKQITKMALVFGVVAATEVVDEPETQKTEQTQEIPEGHLQFITWADDNQLIHVCVGKDTENEHCSSSWVSADDSLWIEGVPYKCDIKTSLCTKGGTDLPPGAKNTIINNFVDGSSRSYLGDFAMYFNAETNAAQICIKTDCVLYENYKANQIGEGILETCLGDDLCYECVQETMECTVSKGVEGSLAIDYGEEVVETQQT